MKRVLIYGLALGAMLLTTKPAPASEPLFLEEPDPRLAPTGSLPLHYELSDFGGNVRAYKQYRRRVARSLRRAATTASPRRTVTVIRKRENPTAHPVQINGRTLKHVHSQQIGQPSATPTQMQPDRATDMHRVNTTGTMKTGNPNGINQRSNRGLPRGRRYLNGRYFGNFNNRFYGPQYGYF